MNQSGRLLGYAWLGVLGVALVCSALITDRRSQQTEEYAYGCDSFGYLQSAQEIRQTAVARGWPRFNLEAPHPRLLIESMQARQMPLEQWEEIIAPHAYHYFPRSGQVGVVYPPGTGLLLAIFPQGEALHRLNRAVIGVFLTTGLCILILAAVRQTWLSAGIVILALHLGLEILGRIGNASFSINAMLAPLLLSSLCLFLALSFQASRVRSQLGVWLFGLLGGFLFGFAILARLPVLFLMPGFLALLFPTALRDWRKGPLLQFGLGVLLGGVLPLGVFQSRLAGAWYLPTYTSSNTAPPTLEVFRSNFAFYLGGGDGSTDNWALLGVALLCICICLVWWSARLGRSGTRIGNMSWPRLTLAALLTWIIPTAYFLTHRIAIHYYAVPATFATALLLALGAFFIEAKENRLGRSSSKRPRVIALALLALAPGLIVMERVWSTYAPPGAEARAFQFRLPPELADERAWVWAGMLTGTLWYYFRKPAHKIQFTGPETRAIVYDFVFSRGEPQYIIRDSPDMQLMEDEIIKLGGTLEPRGDVNGYPYFLIHWPPSGPRKRESASLTLVPGEPCCKEGSSDNVTARFR